MSGVMRLIPYTPCSLGQGLLLLLLLLLLHHCLLYAG